MALKTQNIENVKLSIGNVKWHLTTYSVAKAQNVSNSYEVEILCEAIES